MRRFVVALLLLLPLGNLWAQTLSREEAFQQLQPVITELVALRAINAMQLSQEQMQKLLPIARQSQTVWSDYCERLRAILREQVEAFTAFRAEGLQNVGFTPQVERRTAIANRSGKELMKQFSDTIAGLTQEAASVLTLEQQSIAEQLHAADLGVALRQRVRPMMKRPTKPPTDNPIAQIRSELAAIYRAGYGEITSLGKFLLNPALVSVLEQRLGMTPSPIPLLMDAELLQLERAVKTLRTDINVLNLINGLHLTSEQLISLRELARKASELNHVESQRIDTVAFNELLRTLRVLRDRAANDEFQPILLARAGQSARQAGLLPTPKPRQQFTLREIAAQAATILTDEQKQVIADYKPCLIPPKNLKDPVRVGQATSNEAGIAALRRLRSIPAVIYQRRKGEIIEGLARKIEARGGQYPAEEREAFKQRLTVLVDRVRSLSDADFELQSNELATEFRKLARKEMLKEQLKELTAPSEDVQLMNKIIANLLHPRVEVVVSERLQILANAKPGNAKGLKTLPVTNDGGVCPKPQ